MVKESEEIINRVANSSLVTFNLEDFYPREKSVVLDISNWLFEGYILKEKEFRAYIDTHDWEQYTNTNVAIFCSTDAIVPGWAYMLVASQLQPFAKQIVQGNLEHLTTILYQTIITALDVSAYKDKMVIIKGCSNKPVPPNAYLWLTAKLQPVVKSIMYGEACSSVPLYKRK